MHKAAALDPCPCVQVVCPVQPCSYAVSNMWRLQDAIAEAHSIQQKLMLEESLAWIKQQRRAKREAERNMGTVQHLSPSQGTLVAGANNFEQQQLLQQHATPLVAGMPAEKTYDDEADLMED